MAKLVSTLKLVAGIIVALVILLIVTGHVDSAVNITKTIGGGLWVGIQRFGDFLVKLVS